MKTENNLTLIEYIVVILIALFLLCLILPIGSTSKIYTYEIKAKSMARSIGLTLIAYAEDDIKHFKMPYPLPEGKEKVWGNSKDCWSTSVAELLFKLKYFRKGQESQLKSAVVTSDKFTPMILNDYTIHQDNYWNKNTELDFHIYCKKDMTSNITGKLILVATYDNDDIRNCQFNGKGWVVFYADKTVEFIKRKNFKNFDAENTSVKDFSVNNVEGSIAGPGIILRKNIPESEGGPGTFGNFLGGGSTELMGKRDTDPVYKALVK